MVSRRTVREIPHGELQVPMPLFSLLLLPVLFLAGAISVPWSYIQRYAQRLREEFFAAQMKGVGRSMTWSELESAIEENRGTVIAEYLSIIGPFRLWWTSEDIPATSPFQWNRQNLYAWWEPEFAVFFDWCRKRYTDPDVGAGFLVQIPRMKGTQLIERLEGARFVSTRSFQIEPKNHRLARSIQAAR